MREISILTLGAGQQLCYGQSMGSWAPLSPMHEQPAMHHGLVRPAAFPGDRGSSCSERQQEASLISLDVAEKEGPDLWLMGGKSPCPTCDSPAPSLLGLVSTVASLPGSQQCGRACGAQRGFGSGSFFVSSRANDKPYDQGLPLVPRPWDLVLRATRAAGLPSPGEQLALCCSTSLGDSGASRYCVSAFLRNQVLETAVFVLPGCLSRVLALWRQ